MPGSVIGQVLGNYRLVEKIGDGGMGTVYLAEHVLTHLPVAVKVLHTQHLDDREYVLRFFNEANAALQIQHPAIVRMYDCGKHTDGSAYLIMEYLEGEDLSKRLRGGRRLPVATAILIGRQVAQALEAAHEQGVIHRDLKPDNLFMVPDPDVLGGERVKILDFGIAKLVNDTKGLHKTRTGSVLGTPTYMSPEQCKGTGAVDHRADLYSLGCILFRLMCGRIVFRSTGYGELIAMHIHMPPPRPRTLEPSIPRLFEDIILTLLAKDPNERFQSATELLAVMDDAVANTHLGLPPPETWDEFEPQEVVDVPARRRAATNDETKLYTPSLDSLGDAAARVAATDVSDISRPSNPPTPSPGAYTYDARPSDRSVPETIAMRALGQSARQQGREAGEPGREEEGEAGSASTTLRSATGDVSGASKPGRRPLWIVLALAAVVAVAAAAFVVLYFDTGLRFEHVLPGTDNSDTNAASDPDGEQTGLVTLRIESTPPGAVVIRRRDGARLGVTPYIITRPASAEALVVRIELPGYQPKELAMPSERSSTRRVVLEPDAP